ncbi:carotenoid 1,2-hydratase [Solimonas sp. K1W22B-7]|uniref:lipocalin-like domain-containing protein n=1 Tax=Solimonas sp. K1W22B-7 TaxID=2303331 RepID=UPI000E32F7D4|nr:lipocalin-like domain-containing protein [Solimonas sp. K1W22B-7]AXQ31841.1 carotenoid 1,2-hydratase [Solimonas sp. K1W22B-7]
MLAAMTTTAVAGPPLTAVALPHDEAPHHNFLEWWYFVGHLSGVDPSGQTRKYGYEVTVFQVDAVPPLMATYSAHFAITDHRTGKHVAEHRIKSAAIPNSSNRFDLEVAGWTASGTSGTYALNAVMSDQKYSASLNLQASLPPVLHGNSGIIPYGPFGSSAYYSYTSLNTTGTIVDNGVPIAVTGTSWQDRQWGDFNILAPAGWNWFSIQLSNNVQYMLYYIQDAFGSIVQKVGTKVVNGVATPIPASQMSLDILDYWTSPKSLITYPNKWRVNVPGGSMTVTPVQKAQELFKFGHRTYWEGDSTVTGTLGGQSVNGAGYTEVNPYFQPYLSLP